MFDTVIKQAEKRPQGVQVPEKPAPKDAVDRLDFSDIPLSVVTLPEG